MNEDNTAIDEDEKTIVKANNASDETQIKNDDGALSDTDKTASVEDNDAVQNDDTEISKDIKPDLENNDHSEPEKIFCANCGYE